MTNTWDDTRNEPGDIWHHLGHDIMVNQSRWERLLGKTMKVECDPHICSCKSPFAVAYRSTQRSLNPSPLC